MPDFFLKHKLKIILFIIILTAIIVRFNSVYELAYFQLDEEKDSFLVRRLLIDHKPILVAAGIPGGINMGPAFIYISSVFMAASHLHPLGEAYVAAGLGVIEIMLVYFVGKKLIDTRVGMLASALYAVSYLIVVYNKIYWPLVFNPIISLLSYFLLYHFYKKRDYRVFYPLSLIAILATQSEASNLATLLLIIITMMVMRASLRRKEVLISILLFILGQTPVVLFDFRHNFLNTKNILHFFHTDSGVTKSIHFPIDAFTLVPKTLARIFTPTGPIDLVKQILPCPHLLSWRDEMPVISLIAAILVLVIFVYYLWKENKFGLKLIGAHIGIILAGILLYSLFFPGYIHEWFLYGSFPALCLITGFVLSKFWNIKMFRFPLVVGIICFMGFHIYLNMINQNSFGLKRKMIAVQDAAAHLGNEPFYLSSIGECYSYGGYRYLFELAGKTPTTSYMDATYGDWVYPLHKGKSPTKGVVIVHQSEVGSDIFWKEYKSLWQKSIYHKNFGTLEIFIVDEKLHDGLSDTNQ